ncbi:DMT family transporter [Pullulanibacillus sp. KACC 23026]|uniref:DMT family transporter n=1 Tax=Pullulanibacillus sp. KACC 23026 TaxID=3028315 RepID=UPI0023B040BC|nr:DMT family transporter [Pullulanibacillus sp. KACC 23026]WEG10870.1 DMT family transporter [Pullulanibacillus sp. KACC 23026]
MKKMWVADVGLLVVAFIWGTTFVVVQDAVAVIPPLIFNGWRFLTGALVLLSIYLFLPDKSKKDINWKLIRNGMLLGLILFIGYGTQTLGLLYTTSSKAAFITGLSVILVPLLSFLFLKQAPKKTALIGVILATIGLYLLTMVNSLSLNRGDLLALFCAFAFGLHIIMTAKITNEFSSFLLTIVQLLTVSLLSFVSGSLLNGLPATFDITPFKNGQVLFACLFTAVFATAIAFLFQTRLQRYTSPTHVGLIFIMEPVFAALTALIWAHESLKPATEIGGLLIIAGMVLAEWPEKTKKRLVQSGKTIQEK